MPIAIDEIDKSIQTSNNNKASGLDVIKNEHIKSTFPKLKHIYLKMYLCCIVFNIGLFPESWAIGMIIRKTC